MTKTYHDVEAVTALLQEKEKDLELAAKIGQELLERNKRVDHKVTRLEAELAANQELITQLKHELQVKTDLLRVYTNDLEDSTPHELKSINVELLTRKITELEEDNRTLHAEASKLAAEAYQCEEKEEKLVIDAVKHLTEANSQIKDLHSQFTHKIDESSRQREEINMLLAQVCELQGRVQRYSHENDDLTANLRVYQETQDELTTELSDLKEKYREVVELLRDSQDQLRLSRKRTYPGMGKHSVTGMFTYHQSTGGHDDSLQAEINSSLSKKSSRTISHSESRTKSMLDSEVSDSESEIPMSGSSSYRKAARTYKAIARNSKFKDAKTTSSTGISPGGKSSVGSAFQSYTISRENSFSPDFEDFEYAGGYPRRGGRKFDDEFGASDDSGHGRSTEMSDSLSSSAPREEFRARELLRQATRNRQQSAGRSHQARSAAQDARSVASIGSRPSSTSGRGGLDDLLHGLNDPLNASYSDGASDTQRFNDGASDTHSVRASSPGPISALAEFFTPEYMVSAIARTKSSSTTALYPGAQAISRTLKQQQQTSDKSSSGIEVVEVPTIGQLRRPSFHLSTTLLQATPLGVVPGRNGATVLPHPETPVGLGTVPTRRVNAEPGATSSAANRFSGSDFDETEPLGEMTVSMRQSMERMSGSVESLTASPLPISSSDQTPRHSAHVGGHPGLSQVPSGLGALGGHPGLGQMPGGHPGFAQMPGCHPSLGQIPGGHPGFGQMPGGNPALGQMSGLGQLPGGYSSMSSGTNTSLVMSGIHTISSQASTSGSLTSTVKGDHASLSAGLSSTSGGLVAEADMIGGGQELMDEFGGGCIDIDETEPTQSISITSSSFSRRIDCQILGVDPHSEISQVPTELQSLHGCEDWSYSELREAGDIQFEELGEEFIIAATGGADGGNNAVALLSKGDGVSGFGDSGVISGDYSELSNLNRRDGQGARLPVSSSRGGPDIDALSDGGFCEMGTYPGIMMTEDSGLPPELATTLRYLNPDEVERRRKALRAESMSEFGDSEVIGFDEDMLPYGVNPDHPAFQDSLFTRDTILSRTTSSEFRGGSSNSGLISRLPDKLRIVKPLEGSLTLHHWSRLATPHLGGVLEERVGVAIKGNEKAGLGTLFDMYSLEEEDLEDGDGEPTSVPRTVKEPTRTFNTLTNSTVLHPETTLLSSSYGAVQMATGLDDSRRSTRSGSVMSSRRNSVSEPGSREGVYCVSTNLGLSKILEQRKISGVRRSQLDLRSSMTSLTPSVLSYPGSRNMSPTDTPCHTPEESLPGSPEESSGLVYSFFSSLKSAIYGEQRKEHKNTKRRGKKKLGIMEAVTEVGIENILSDRESTPGSLPGLELEGFAGSSAKKPTLTKSQSCLSDFDARYLGALDDFDELEEIEPGSLTVNETGNWTGSEDYTAAWIGQLTLPSYSMSGRPAMETTQLGKVPDTQDEMRIPVNDMGGRGPGRIMAPGEIKPHHLSGLGVPANPGSGAIRQASASTRQNARNARRRDLGTIPGFRQHSAASSSLNRDDITAWQQQSYYHTSMTTTGTYRTPQKTNFGSRTNDAQPMPTNETFVGSMTSMFFGRKGGYL